MKGRPAAIGGTSGVEEKDPLPAEAEGMVTVSKDHPVDSLAVKFPEHPVFQPVGSPPSVRHADTKSADLDDTPERDADGRRVHVPLHRVDLARAEGVENVGVDHIAGMEDDLTVVEVPCRQRLEKGQRPMKIGKVGIRKNSNFYHDAL